MASSVRPIRRLGVGRSTELWLAEDEDEPGRPVVLKRGTTPDALARLAAEAARLESVRSPNLVRFLGRAPDGLILEHIEGVDLGALFTHLARRGGALHPGAVAGLICDLAAALTAMHDAGWVHADVAPSNVLLDRSGVARLIDLGAATSLGAVALEGTMAYQAPEQLRGLALGPTADLFSLGLIAYELLTGVLARPLGDVGALELALARASLPTPPSTVRPGVSAVWDELLLAVLNPSPERRPQSAAELVAQLQAAGLSPDRPRLAEAVRSVHFASSIPVAETRAPGEEAAVAPTLVIAAAPTQLLERAPPAPASARRIWGPLLGAALLVGTAASIAWLREPVRVELPVQAPVATPAPIAHRPERMAVQPSTVAETPPSPRATKPPPAAPSAPPARPMRPDPPKLEPIARPVAEPPRVSVRNLSAAPSSPAVTGPLADNSTAFVQVQLNDALRLLVRAERHGAAVRVNLGAPEGRYYLVACGGEPPQPTPRLGLSIEGRLECAIEDKAGARFRLELALIR